METWNYFSDFFSSPLGGRTLIMSVIVGSMCGVLGCFIVLRNMSLLGDALSHAILPGIVVSFILFGYSTLGFFAGSVSAGLLSAVLITWMQQKFKIKNDAAIGIIFTFMFSLGVIGISWLSDKQGVHLDLKDFLFGNILTVSQEDVYLTFSMAIIVFITIFLFYRQLFTTSFQDMIAGTLGINSRLVHYLLMLLLSLAVVASLRSVGVILVVSMLITPASAALLLADRLPIVLIWSAILGIVSAFFGLILSISVDIPVGPSMAVTTTLIYFLVGLFAPSKGFIARWLTRKKIQAKVIIEDIVKRSMKSHKNQVIDMDLLAIETGHAKAKINKYMDQLLKLGLFTKVNEQYHLTELGIQRGSQLIRAHRLWETFMVEELGLNADQIHEEAEKAEHLLTEEDINSVDERLGYPEVDPHGSPIPR